MPDSLRAFSSAMSMLVYNILGYAMGTFLPGVCVRSLLRYRHRNCPNSDRC